MTTIQPQHYRRYISFIIFDPSSSRVSNADVMVSGDQVPELFEKIVDGVQGNSLKTSILNNRLSKIQQMLELLTSYEHVIISKFFDKIWRRYTYVSNIGEVLMDLETYLTIFPEKKKQIDSILALRMDEEEDEEKEEVDDEPKQPEKVTQLAS